MGIWVIIFCAVVWIVAYHLAEAETKKAEEEQRRKIQEAAEAAQRLKEWQKEQERRRKAAEKEAKEKAKAAQKAAEEARKAAERAERAERNQPQIEDLTRVLEAKTNLAIALENAAAKETDPVKKAAMHERAARTYAQAHSVSEKIDKLMEGRI